MLIQKYNESLMIWDPSPQRSAVRLQLLSPACRLAVSRQRDVEACSRAGGPPGPAAADGSPGQGLERSSGARPGHRAGAVDTQESPSASRAAGPGSLLGLLEKDEASCPSVC